MIKLLYFMKLAEIIGCSQEELQLPEDVVNVAGLLAWSVKRGEHYRTALWDVSRVQVTINKKFVEAEALIKDGDEVAFFPKAK